jgi:hypothetical protein
MRYIMKSLLSISVFTLLELTTNAQTMTTIETKILPNGEKEVAVEYTKKNDFVTDSYQQADKNNDNCIDKKEAVDLGDSKL